MANEGGTLTIDNSWLTQNNALAGGGDGGAIANIGVAKGTPTILRIRNTSIFNNSARLGGAISQWNSTNKSMSLVSVTLSNNFAESNGSLAARGVGGIFSDGDPVSVRGSIIDWNFDQAVPPRYDCSGPFIDLGGNVEERDECGFTSPASRQNVHAVSGTAWFAGGEVMTEPTNVDDAGIDLIPAADCPTATDARGVPRPQSGACDAGAYELRAIILAGPTRPAPALSSQTVVAKLDDPSNPSRSVPITFTVLSGPDAGRSETVTPNGSSATWTLTGAAPGEDVVEASFVDRGVRQTSDPVTLTWTGPAQAISLAPDNSSAPIGNALPLTGNGHRGRDAAGEHRCDLHRHHRPAHGLDPHGDHRPARNRDCRPHGRHLRRRHGRRGLSRPLRAHPELERRAARLDRRRRFRS